MVRWCWVNFQCRDTVEPVRIFSFLKEIGLNDKIKFSKVEVCLTTFYI